MSARTGTRISLSGIFAALISGTAATILATTIFAGGIAAQQAPNATPAAHTPPAKAPAPQKQHGESEGELLFTENCSRCHTAPDGFSEKISGTVIRHMRVRASLSEQDEKALLRFLNP